MSASVQLEATAKSLKAIQLVGVLAMLGSLAAGFFYRHDVGPRRGAMGAAAGLGVYLLGKFLAWWRHG